MGDPGTPAQSGSFYQASMGCDLLQKIEGGWAAAERFQPLSMGVALALRNGRQRQLATTPPQLPVGSWRPLKWCNSPGTPTPA
jgi:hypothetical protein